MHRRRLLVFLLTALTVASFVWNGVAAQSADPSPLFFSEYIEGSSNNKALEIYNSANGSIDLAAGGYNVQMFFNGSTSAGLTINLNGVVAGGDVFVLAQSSANAAILAQADQTNGAGWFNGDDAVILRQGTVIIDAIGQIGVDPGSEWGTGLTSTADNTLRRKAGICVGDTNATDAFDPGLEWDGFVTDTVDGLGSHTADCGGGGAETPTPTVEPSPTPTPIPVDPCLQPFTPIPAIQGAGIAAAITGTVTTQGVVVGDYEGPSPTLRGFYLQDFAGDGDPATSDGIFVFNGNNNSVQLGDIVRVVGTAGEFQDQTQISSSAILKCGVGAVNPVDITLPVPDAAYLERFEGMLVRLPQRLYVTEHFQLGRFGQVVVTTQQDRQRTPTDVAFPGVEALAVAEANRLNRIIVDDALNSQNPDPVIFARNGAPLSAGNTLRGGDYTDGLLGVMTYTWAGNAASGNAYRLRPVNALGSFVNFQEGNPRPAAPTPAGGTVSVASFNLLNYFNTFTGCTNGVGGAPTDCRGANNPAEFARQVAKSVPAVTGLDAAVVGLIELENDGYGPDSAIRDLVERVNAATAPGAYALIDVDAATGQVNALGTDAIKVGFIYKPALVTPVGQTAVLNSAAFVNGGDGSARNRPALAQAFRENATGATFVVVVNHLKSKGSACDLPDQGDGQGNCNAVRTAAATELAEWLKTKPTGVGGDNVLIVGDLNSYALEDPIRLLEATGYTNLLRQFNGPAAYSYVFNGEWGYLDHALASSTLLPNVTGVTEWHINADEPNVLDYNTEFKSAGQIASFFSPDAFRSSDHDPLLVGLCMPPALDVTVTPNVLWPPNHKYVTVNSTIVTGANVNLSVVVTSNEPDNGLGDGDTPNDVQVISPYAINLRAERSGSGNGRVYTLHFRAVSACGAETYATAEVSVPHSRPNRTFEEGDFDVVVEAEDTQPNFANGLFLPLINR